MNPVYGFLIGALIMGLFWLFIFYRRKDLRTEMIFGGLLALPFGFAETYFVPIYWNPPSLFDFIRKFGFGIEDFLFLFFVGGIAAVLYELLFRVRTEKITSDHRLHLLPYLSTALVYIFIQLLSPKTPMLNYCAALFWGTALIVIQRRDLFPQVLISAFLFTTFYFLFYQVFFILYPDYIEQYFNLQNFSGLEISNVPLEELAFAFFGSAFWSTLFEYTRGYRTKFFLGRRKIMG